MKIVLFFIAGAFSLSFEDIKDYKCFSITLKESNKHLTCAVDVGGKNCSDYCFNEETTASGVAWQNIFPVKTTNQICQISFSGKCSHRIVDDSDSLCFEIIDDEASLNSAISDCKSRESELFVPSNDHDLSRLVKLIKEKIDRFWIGGGTIFWRTCGKAPPNSKGVEVGVLFTIQNKKESLGYSITKLSTDRYPYICARRNRKHRECLSFGGREHKPTKAPVERDPRSIIQQAGTVIYRFYHPTLHYYTMRNNNWDNERPGWANETGYAALQNFGNVATPLYVVSASTREQLRRECPELVEGKIAHRAVKGMSAFVNTYVGNGIPSDWNDERNPTETFYCAPRQFYCGANFQLKNMWHKNGLDLLTPSTDLEAYLYLFGSTVPELANLMKNNDYVANRFNAMTNCWIWTYQSETTKSKVRASGGMIWRYRNDKDWVHYYSMTPLVNPSQQNCRPELGVHVVDENGWQNGFNRLCPELIKMGVYQGRNEKRVPITYLGNKPPGGFTYQSSFYCAPRQGYCDADNSLTRIDKINNYPGPGYGSDIFYPSNSAQKTSVVGGGAKGWNSVVEETGCWTWAMYWSLP